MQIMKTKLGIELNLGKYVKSGGKSIPIERVNLEMCRFRLKSTVHDLQLAAIEVTPRYLPSFLILKCRCQLVL